MVFVDAGANADVDPADLLDFAAMVVPTINLWKDMMLNLLPFLTLERKT